MTVQHLFEATDPHKDCEKCDLAKYRKEKGQSVCFGQGMADAVALIIADTPKYQEGNPPMVYPRESEEWAMLKAIFDRVGLLETDFYITSAIACKGSLTDERAISCRSRLSDTVYGISPRLVICLGPEGLTAFAGKSDKTSSTIYGLVLQNDNYLVYNTRSINKYLERKRTDPTGAREEAIGIMADWVNIKKLIDRITKGEV